MKNIQIWGGDGYLGWPTAMHLSNLGHNVTVVDNYLRRNICKDMSISMLYDVPDLIERAKIWHEKTGKVIKVVITDLDNIENSRSLFNEKAKADFNPNEEKIKCPDVVVHYAEQPSAPYSLYSHEKASHTIVNNLKVTNNLMFCAKDFNRDLHIVKLGTMGEYGTPNIDIEEGWLDIEHKGRSQKFLFPRQASSIYHTTKIMDTDLLWFGVRMWGLRVTDLMQGPVYGVETEFSKIDERLNSILIMTKYLELLSIDSQFKQL